MRNKLPAVILCLLTLFLVLGVVTYAQSQVRIIENHGSAHFSKALLFSLIAEADQTIEHVTLYYRQQGELGTSRIRLEVTPGKRIEAQYEKPLERGQMPPGTVIEYYWRLDLADGTQSDTEHAAFVYEDERFTWHTAQAGSLTFYYYGESQQALVRDLSNHGQETLARLQNQIGISLERPVRIYIYQNSSDMAAAIAARSEGYEQRVVTLGMTVNEDVLLLLAKQDDPAATLAHELCHIVTGQATQNPYAPLPRWLDEGLAMLAEGEGLSAQHTYALKSAVRSDSLISIQSLSSYSGDPSQVDLYYAEAHSVVDYMLRTYGREKMSAFLKAFKEGTTTEDALQRVYGLTLAELEAQWRQSLGLSAHVTPGPTKTPSPVTPPRTANPCASSLALALTGLVVACRPRAWRR